MPKKHKSRALHAADHRGQYWIGLPKCVYASSAFRLLSFQARAVLTVLMSRFNGSNNGALGVSYREIAQDCGMKNQAWIAPALAELITHGFVEVMMESTLQPRRSRTYRLTFISSGTYGHVRPATNEYLSWSPA